MCTADIIGPTNLGMMLNSPEQCSLALSLLAIHKYKAGCECCEMTGVREINPLEPNWSLRYMTKPPNFSFNYCLWY